MSPLLLLTTPPRYSKNHQNPFLLFSFPYGIFSYFLRIQKMVFVFTLQPNDFRVARVFAKARDSGISRLKIHPKSPLCTVHRQHILQHKIIAKLFLGTKLVSMFWIYFFRNKKGWWWSLREDSEYELDGWTHHRRLWSQRFRRRYVLFFEEQTIVQKHT